MKYLSLLLILFFVGVSLVGFGQQKSIKAYKQKTHFFYTSLNLQAGCYGDKEDLHWMPINRNPLNQLAFTYKSKNRRLLQKGYVPFLHISNTKANIALAYDNDISPDGEYNADLKFSVRDLWITLASKWDRTSLRIGNFSLPFGHNPKVDPDYSFIPNIGGADLGLSRDFGFLFKTPLSQMLDLELSLTSGGLLRAPIMTSRLVGLNEGDTDFSKITYNGDGLLTVRVGNPTFRRNEFGAFVIAGRMPDASAEDNHTDVYRVGFDWIHKHKEHFRLTNQLLLGTSIIDPGNSHFKIVQQSNMEFFLLRQWILYATNNIQLRSESGDSFIKGTFAGGGAYAFNPHTRIKLNVFSNYDLTDTGADFGAFLQLVAGFGTR